MLATGTYLQEVAAVSQGRSEKRENIRVMVVGSTPTALGNMPSVMDRKIIGLIRFS